MKDAPLTFQAVMMALQRYWAEQGCLIGQPYHTEVGAGTMNPTTVLRVLGPEPWRVAYVEPSIRPADGRYGENPNRWQHYFQFQVILKPDPGNPQELFLDSLVALGIDPAEHDIRFVEDNWEQPALGAWGLGWEVWLDGQEITQFTYFQQAGGVTLDPVSVEITYGLERIVMSLQQVDTFVDIRWDEHLTYGDVYLIPEAEFCRYNFEVADVARLRVLHETYQREAEEALERGLVFPAHDYVLKSSHAFNILDARGAVGVTERAAMFGKMRGLAHRISQAYLREREEQGYPWMDRWRSAAQSVPKPEPGEPAPEGPADFVLEVLTEELPSGDLASAVSQLQERLPEWFDDHRLHHEGIDVTGTPRRLAVAISNLAPFQEDLVTQVKGPPAERAFDETGNPTQAAIGFARGRGIPVADLKVTEMDGGRYVVAEVRETGRPADEVLAYLPSETLEGLRFDKRMRWNSESTSFSRPIRGLLALHGRHPVPLTFAGLEASPVTTGLRFRQPASIDVSRAGDYMKTMNEHGIVVQVAERQESIWQRAVELAAEVEGQVSEDASLLEEVTNLIESPTVFRGSISQEYLSLPRAVLISVMKKHQRYFPVERNGELLPYFIGVRNGDADHLDVVTQGNERVLKARFADADYFVRRDLERSLEDFVSDLAMLTFQSELGSMLDKVQRLERLVPKLGEAMGLSREELEAAQRAAHLCKADLATRMVVEMTSLQGEIGRIYAERSGEPPEVAQAVFEHYLPRFAGDQLPASGSGAAVGLADRLDSIIGLFSVGLQPSGSGDPYALRRSAIGALQILIDRQVNIDLAYALTQAADGLPLSIPEGTLEACLEFLRGRQQALLSADGRRHDIIEAVLNEQANNPAAVVRAVDELEAWVQKEGWARTLQAYARCARITRELPDQGEVDRAAFEEPAEETLYAALEAAKSSEGRHESVEAFLAAFVPMIPAIDKFFEDVLVMVEEANVRRNRLALLQAIVSLASGLVDMSALEGF